MTRPLFPASQDPTGEGRHRARLAESSKRLATGHYCAVIAPGGARFRPHARRMEQRQSPGTQPGSNGLGPSFSEKSKVHFLQEGVQGQDFALIKTQIQTAEWIAPRQPLARRVPSASLGAIS